MVRPKGFGFGAKRHSASFGGKNSGERDGVTRVTEDLGAKKTVRLLAVDYLSYVRRPWNLTFMIKAVPRSSTMVAVKPGVLTSFW